MQSLKNATGRARIAAAAAVVTLAIGAGGAHAYPMYDDGFGTGCVSCHADFQSVGSLHNIHVNTLNIVHSPDLVPGTGTDPVCNPPVYEPINNRCNVCHTNGGGSTPVFTMGSNQADGGGFGCAGCHGQDYGENATTVPYNGEPKASGWGLRRVHQAAGVVVCQACHGTGPAPLDETVAPPYYAMQISDLRNSCDSAQEDLTYDMDSVGLDNDGNGFADYSADLNCPLPTTSTTSTTTSTTLPPLACDPSPEVICTAAEKAKLSINEKAAGKQKLKFQLSKLVPLLAQADFGDPVAGDTSYMLCVYNAASALVGSYEVDRAGDNCGGLECALCWEEFKDTGYNYGDKTLLTADGVSKLQLAGGDAGKGKVKLQASNKNSTMPTGIAALLSGATSATAQLVNSDGDCYGMPLPTVKKNDGLQFNAQAP